jgi:hypothetical protein
VQYNNLLHKDGSSLPPDEGGTFCGAGSREEVTRISNGGEVSASFDRDTTYFEVMVAFRHGINVGVGDAVLSACSATMAYTLYAGPDFSLPGFVSMPMNVPAGCRTWALTALGGYVDFRSVDVYYVAAPPTATPTLTFTPTSTAVFTSTATPILHHNAHYHSQRDVYHNFDLHLEADIHSDEHFNIYSLSNVHVYGYFHVYLYPNEHNHCYCEANCNALSNADFHIYVDFHSVPNEYNHAHTAPNDYT